MKYIAMYIAPVGALEEWMKVPEEERNAEEAKMKEQWNVWMAAHGSMIVETNGTGATKRVSSEGVSDAKNGIMLYSIVEGESAEAVAEAFKDHPHFGIPGGTIEIMPLRPMVG